jgi:hypothetical protein
MSQRGYNWILELKKQTGKNIPELLALTRENDPFFAGTAVHWKKAKWFATMWKREYEGQTGIHLRRVHYHLDAKKNVRKLDGKPYRNAYKDWCYLLECSKFARDLYLVPADAFDDHQNPDPYPLNWRGQRDVEYSPDFMDPYFGWDLPSLRCDLSSADWRIGTPQVSGYTPHDYQDRAYLCELWIEKSTMDDVLRPLADDLGIRLVPSTGFQSITNAVKLLQRIHKIRKPARVFRTMPISVARQIEFWQKDYAPDADIKLMVLGLTQAQITHYKLPYSVDKKGSVELDALEALHPGELAKIVRQALQPYLDDTISDRLADAEALARRIVREEWSELMKPERQKLEALQKQIQAVTKKYQREAADVNRRLKRELKPFERPLLALRDEATKRASHFDPDLPERPTQTETEHEESDWLFDSSREYFEQLPFYKAQRDAGGG